MVPYESSGEKQVLIILMSIICFLSVNSINKQDGLSCIKVNHAKHFLPSGIATT